MCILCFLCSLCCFPLQLSPSVLWYCWLGLLTCKNRRPYNLYCVGGDVKPCSTNQPSFGCQSHTNAFSFRRTTSRTSCLLGHEFDLSRSRDGIGHVTIWFPAGHFLLVDYCPLEPSLLSLTVCKIFNAECDAMVDINKCQGHLFWYQSIPHICDFV